MQLGPSVPQPPEDTLLILVADGPYLGTICCFIKCIWENLPSTEGSMNKVQL